MVLRPWFSGPPIQDKEQRQLPLVHPFLHLWKKRVQFTARTANNQRKLYISVHVGGLCLGRGHWFMTQEVFLDNEREPSSLALPVSCWLACVTAEDWAREGIWLQDYLAGRWLFSSWGICLSCFRHAAEFVLQALSTRGTGWAGAGPSSCGSAANTHLESVTTWNKPINRIMQEWPWTNVFPPDLVLVLQVGQFITVEDGQVALAVAWELNSSQKTGVKGNQTTTKFGLLKGLEPRSLRKYRWSKLTGTHLEQEMPSTKGFYFYADPVA